MSVTRLNESRRNFLKELAQKAVRCPDLEVLDAKAYAKAAPLVRKAVEAKHPTNEMRILAKYECATHDRVIRLQLTAGGVVQFYFRREDRGPLRPDGRTDSIIYAADETATDAIVASLTATTAFREAFTKKLQDYYALIRHSTTLEQIEAVWPAASALREHVGRTLPVVLSEDVIARIKADNAQIVEKVI